MKLSWSHKLFLKINRKTGAHPKLDRVMQFCAHWLIFAIAGVMLIWLIRLSATGRGDLAWLIFKTGLIAWVLSMALSYAIGYLWPHRRPVREFPSIRELLSPMNTWKAFPSDHTITVTIPIVLAVQFFAPVWFVAVLVIAGLMVGIGRIYVGVHYPRDIIGGAVIGALFTILVFSQYAL
ncbi:MAG: phosphatase PAP2 family protein [Candidatus Magasanikbacteria bacterium]|jgi:undecaprenyl-diphosphatase|nr:phosphatase PAP2 family protein [Candidatus Magasanikbacteria bacterium]